MQREERQSSGHGSSDHSHGLTWKMKAGEHRETIGHAHAGKQSQKGNGKAATWEKSSIGGGACFWHAEGKKGFLHMQRKGRKEKNSAGMSIFAMRVKSERKTHNKEKVPLTERGKEEVLRVRRTD